MVGDSTWDCEAAEGRQVKTIAVRTGGFGVDELRDAGAIAVFELDRRAARALALDGARVGDGYGNHRQDHGPLQEGRGDLDDDAALRREGKNEERKGEAKDELANAQDKAEPRPTRSRTSSARPPSGLPQAGRSIRPGR